MGAIVATMAIAGCGTTVSEPITLDSTDLRSTLMLDPTKQVKDLSAAEAAAWCDAYVTGMVHQIESPTSPSDGLCSDYVPVKDGFIDSCGGIACGSEPWLCVLVPTIDLCVQNLMLNPCEAMLSELDDCVDSIQHAVNVGDVCGGACGPLRSHPSCLETVVHEFDYFEVNGPSCRLQVE
jgi:hypothetical protein